MTKRITESGLYVDPPEGYFRLDQQAYFVKRFKRYGLCEMDFGWWDAPKSLVHLLELKDYSLHTLPPDLASDLAQKATDCLLLLASMYHDLPHAAGIKAMLPEPLHARPAFPGGIRLMFVIKRARPEKAHELHTLKDQLGNLLGGRLELLGLRDITKVFVLDQWTARELGVPIEIQDEFEDDPQRKRSKQRKQKR